MPNEGDSLLPPPPPRRAGETFVSEDDELGEDAMMRMILPVGRSVWAIVAGYLGLISVLVVPAPFALIAGIIAIVEIRKNPKKHGMGRAIFGVVMGGLFSVVAVLIAIVALFEAIHHR